MKPHPFDAAVALTAQAAGQYTGKSSPAYWNMVGPFGGTTAATAMNAVLLHPARLGEPIALTVNYAGAMASGPFTVSAVAARTNRSTQHWVIEVSQTDAAGAMQVIVTASAVTAARRETWGVNDTPMPQVPPPADFARLKRGGGVEWVKRYEMRFVAGQVPTQWDGQGDDSLTQLWMRDDPPRVADFNSLTALADVFFPRAWLRRATRVPAGTVSMTVYFHADSEQLAGSGKGYLLGQARAQAFRKGFFDQTGQLWNESGILLATTHQIVYFKQ